MHEMSIATSLMEQLLRVAQEQRAIRITEVEVVCGAMQLVVPEALKLAFEAVTAETVAAGAELKLVEERLMANCRACGTRFEPAIDNYLCPQCRVADVDIVAGKDIVLKSVVCQTEERAAS